MTQTAFIIFSYFCISARVDCARVIPGSQGFRLKVCFLLETFFWGGGSFPLPVGELKARLPKLEVMTLLAVT